jgi:hypothetical protein
MASSFDWRQMKRRIISEPCSEFCFILRLLQSMQMLIYDGVLFQWAGCKSTFLEVLPSKKYPPHPLGPTPGQISPLLPINILISSHLHLGLPTAVAYPGILFWGGVQQIQLRTQDRENGDRWAVVPLSNVLLNLQMSDTRSHIRLLWINFLCCWEFDSVLSKLRDLGGGGGGGLNLPPHPPGTPLSDCVFPSSFPTESLCFSSLPVFPTCHSHLIHSSLAMVGSSEQNIVDITKVD